MRVVGISFTFYMYGCPDCAAITQQDSSGAPPCINPDCSNFGNAMLPWHEMVERIQGEGWKHA